MVRDLGKTPGIISLRQMNLPEPVEVLESKGGEPTAVKMASWRKVLNIDDRWRIDDEWWRSNPISRLYYAVRFASGQRLVIFKDLIGGKWYRQYY